MSTELIPVSAITTPMVREVLLTPVMNLATAKARLATFQEFCSGYLTESANGGQDGGDYGVIPGAGSKKVLLKSGADKLCEVYGLYDEYDVQAEENFESNLFYYKVKCILKSRRDDSTVGTGLGSCSTFESKYRWRDSQRKCPKCEQATIIKGREEYGGGWLCFAKKGGCGQKFKDDDKSIIGQTIGRMENPDILDTVNTVLKMAKKRAKIDAVIGVTRSSGIFTQDLEDIVAEAKPVVPEVAKTTEPTKIAAPPRAATRPEASVPAGVSPAPPAGKPSEGAVRGKPEEPASSATSGPSELIDAGMQANFAKAFREALPVGLQKRAEELRHDWLGMNFFIDADSNPTSKVIKKSEFTQWRDAACKWASEQK